MVLEITQDNTVIRGETINESIRIKAHNVRIERCKITAPDDLYVIQANFKDKKGRPFKGTEILRNGISDGRTAMLVQHSLVRGNYIHDMVGDGIKCDLGGNVWIHKNIIHKIGSDPTSHADGIQLFGGERFLISHNIIEMPKDEPGFTPNACVFAESNFQPLHTVWIQHNQLNGGNYTVYLKDQSFGIPENARLIGNEFGDGFAFGPLFATKPSSILIGGNRWAASGKPMGINNIDS